MPDMFLTIFPPRFLPPQVISKDQRFFSSLFSASASISNLIIHWKIVTNTFAKAECKKRRNLIEEVEFIIFRIFLSLFNLASSN